MQNTSSLFTITYYLQKSSRTDLVKSEKVKPSRTSSEKVFGCGSRDLEAISHKRFAFACPPCGTRNFLRLGAPKSFDHCGICRTCVSRTASEVWQIPTSNARRSHNLKLSIKIQFHSQNEKPPCWVVFFLARSTEKDIVHNLYNYRFPSEWD